jgi:hypothetical protein
MYPAVKTPEENERKLIGQRENVYQHFKFTKRATRSIVIWGALFPAFIAGVAYVYDVSDLHCMD